MKYLSSDQISNFERDGFLVIERFWDEDTVKVLRDQMSQILSKLDLSDPSSGSIFTTNDQTRKSDDYFLNSGHNISFFWEEKAWDDEGKLKFAPIECINKVGHGLHDVDPEFEKVSYDGRIASITRQLGMSVPTAVQSMYIFKQAHCGGEVGAHQDGAFLYTEPQTCLGFWWALDDCCTDNGCLWAVPGSHRLPVRRRFCRKSPGSEYDGCGTEWRPVPLIIPKGSLVLLHSAVVHYSEGNTSPAARHAYSIHVVDGAEGCRYPSDNWLQRPADVPFRTIKAGGGAA
eukprot:GSChrysophyteH1.ASY1.ANO1.1387.1 assembled CDS